MLKSNIYLSNESPEMVDVYFDDLTITHKHSPVIQEDGYYPFGMVASSSKLEARSMRKNDFLYQGQEFQDDLDLGWYQFKWRMHDPAIGRFMAVDPLAEDYFYNSPYAFSENKVTSHIELEGLEAVAVTNMASEFDGTPYEWGGKVPAFQGGLPQGMTHQWYMENIGNPSSEAGGALWFNPNYSNEVNLSQYLSGSQNSCGIDCSGLAFRFTQY